MKFLSNNLSFLLLTLFVVINVGGSSACAQSNSSVSKTNFTNADFEKLRWLEGTWRGSDTNGQNPFFERYRFVGNANIEIDSFSDATLSKVDSQGSIYLKDGEIIHKSGTMVWSASKSDGSLIDFVPKENATNSFAWQKESADVWRVRLAGKDGQGKPTEKVFRMERVKQ